LYQEGGTNLQAIIDNIHNGYLDGAEIVRVISSNPSAYALQRAADNGIKGVCISKKLWPDPEIHCQKLLEELENAGSELIVLAGYMSILHPRIVDKYRNRIINIHPSLIPKYCGMGFYGERVHKAVIENKEKISGATVHYVDEGVDTGDIIVQEQVPVMEDDTPETLAKRVLVVEHRILPAAIKMFIDAKCRQEGQ
jgi:phosphoribosylglycinamide formyltransferase-1